jgi:SPP1 gp7 family putative phage head morphogenesis protein
MQCQLKKELDRLGNKQAQILQKKFLEEWSEIYKGVAIKNDLFFGEVDKETALQMINHIWCADGKSWSQRVWDNVSKLQETLNDGLIECVLAGAKPTELKQILQARFGVSYSAANTLVRTEMAHIQTQAAQKRYTDYGIQMVEVWADKDERQCEVCGKLHKTRYPVGATMPIPAHPNCRCTIIPVVD